MTLRHLGKRVNEHRKSAKSACFQHEKKSKHKMAYDLAEIIDTADTKTKLQAKEALHILREKPSLNKQLNSQESFDLKMLIIAAHSAKY